MQFAKSILLITSIVGAAQAAAFAVEDTNSIRFVSETVAESDVLKLKRVASDSIVARGAGLDHAGTDLPLEKRACTGSCKCAKGTKRGQYCGMCSQVLYSGSGFDYANDIFESVGPSPFHLRPSHARFEFVHAWDPADTRTLFFHDRCNPEGGCCSYGKSSTCAGSDAQDRTHCPK
ncbi:hypothetical protein PG999_001017 [Apiospora kogelbergensis]|uniref:Uncharacterized protein n=1 Tax=Apiospora kogelbergensis TaxID=1337665 RepID=A0AAW0RDP1_9PEZI